MIALILALILSIGAQAETGYLFGRVARVIDGDTIVVDTTTVRLAWIDAPERNQPWGENATLEMESMVAGHPVDVDVVAWDRYGRAIGVVTVDHANAADWPDINTAMVTGGHAWVYRKYSDDPALLLEEAKARQDRRGLWALPADEIMEPWKWRKKR